MITAACPSRDELEAFALGSLPDGELESIAGHLDGCEACEATAAILDDGSDELLNNLRRPVADSPFAGESQQREAILAAVGAFARPRDSDPGETGGPALLSDDASGSCVEGVLRDYQLLGKLGEGGMGTVHRALHRKLRRVVALKILPAHRRDASSVSRFTREIHAVGKFDHPNIVKAYDAGDANGMHFMVMELIDGLNLHQLVKQQGPLRVSDACEIVRQAALGLSHAHQHGVIHRDLKPSNVLLSRAGDVKVLDLGLALFADENQHREDLTCTGQVMGTLDYMSPEQATDSHRVDHRTDLYGLGCTLFKLLAGHAPFGGDEFRTPAKKILAHAEHDPPKLRDVRQDVPESLEKLVSSLLEKEPHLRPDSADQLAELLQPLADDSDLTALGARIVSPIPDSTSAADESEIAVMLHQPISATRRNRFGRWRLPAVAVSLIFVLLAAGVIITIRRRGQQDTRLETPPGSHLKIDDAGNAVVTLPDEQRQLFGKVTGVDKEKGIVHIDAGRNHTVSIGQRLNLSSSNLRADESFGPPRYDPISVAVTKVAGEQLECRILGELPEVPVRPGDSVFLASTNQTRKEAQHPSQSAESQRGGLQKTIREAREKIQQAFAAAKDKKATDKQAAIKLLWEVQGYADFLAEHDQQGLELFDKHVAELYGLDPTGQVQRRLTSAKEAKHVERVLADLANEARKPKKSSHDILRQLVKIGALLERARTMTAERIDDPVISRATFARIDYLARQIYGSVTVRPENTIVLDTFDAPEATVPLHLGPFKVTFTAEGYVVAAQRPGAVDLWLGGPHGEYVDGVWAERRPIKWQRFGTVKDVVSVSLGHWAKGIEIIDARLESKLDQHAIAIRSHKFTMSNEGIDARSDYHVPLSAAIDVEKFDRVVVHARSAFYDKPNERMITYLFLRAMDRDRPVRGQLLCLRSDDGGATWWDRPVVIAANITWPLHSTEAINFQPSADQVGCFAQDADEKPVLFRSGDGGKSWHREYLALTDSIADADAQRIPLATLDLYGRQLIYAVMTGTDPATYRLARCDSETAELDYPDFRAWKPGTAITDQLSIHDHAFDVRVSGRGAIKAVTYMVPDATTQRPEARLIVSLDDGRTWKNIPLTLDGRVEATALLSMHGDRILLAADVINPQRNDGRHQLVVQEMRLGPLDIPPTLGVEDRPHDASSADDPGHAQNGDPPRPSSVSALDKEQYERELDRDARRRLASARDLAKTNQRQAVLDLYALRSELLVQDAAGYQVDGLILVESEQLMEAHDPTGEILAPLTARDFIEYRSRLVDDMLQDFNNDLSVTRQNNDPTRDNQKWHSILSKMMALKRDAATATGLQPEDHRKLLKKYDWGIAKLTGAIRWKFENPIVLDTYKRGATVPAGPIDLIVSSPGYVLSSQRGEGEAPGRVWGSTGYGGPTSWRTPKDFSWKQLATLDAKRPRLVATREGVLGVGQPQLDGDELSIPLTRFSRTEVDQPSREIMKWTLAAPIRPERASHAVVHSVLGYGSATANRQLAIFLRLVDKDNAQRSQLVCMHSADGKSWSAPVLVADSVWADGSQSRLPDFCEAVHHPCCFAWDAARQLVIFRSWDGGKAWSKESVVLKDTVAAPDAMRIPVAMTPYIGGLIYAVPIGDEEENKYRLCYTTSENWGRSWESGVPITPQLFATNVNALNVSASGNGFTLAVSYVTGGHVTNPTFHLVASLTRGETWNALPLPVNIAGHAQRNALFVASGRIILVANVSHDPADANSRQLIVQEIHAIPERVDRSTATTGDETTARVALLGPVNVIARTRTDSDSIFASRPVVFPGETRLPTGTTTRVKLMSIPDYVGTRLYPTIEIPKPTADTKQFLGRWPIPIRFSQQDLDAALAGKFVTMVVALSADGKAMVFNDTTHASIYNQYGNYEERPVNVRKDAPTPELQDPAPSPATSQADGEIVETRVDPGQDPIVVARQFGAILAIVRLGDIDVEGRVDWQALPAFPRPKILSSGTRFGAQSTDEKTKSITWEFSHWHKDVHIVGRIEMPPLTDVSRRQMFLSHCSIPIKLDDDDIQFLATGKDLGTIRSDRVITRVLYLPSPEFQELALGGVETLVSTRLDSGLDPVAEARRRGTILAVMRFTSKPRKEESNAGSGHLLKPEGQ